MKRWHFFRRQPRHLLLLLALCGGLWLASLIPGFLISHDIYITVGAVVVMSIAIGAAHQLWVLVFWRLELGSSAITRRFGNWGFKIYSLGFVLLVTARTASIFYLAPINGGTLPLPLAIRLLLVGIIAVLNAWGIYSVIRYFGIRRAFGLDHFNASIRLKGLVKEGA